jgi:hypothetical protein
MFSVKVLTLALGLGVCFRLTLAVGAGNVEPGECGYDRL